MPAPTSVRLRTIYFWPLARQLVGRHSWEGGATRLAAYYSFPSMAQSGMMALAWGVWGVSSRTRRSEIHEDSCSRETGWVDGIQLSSNCAWHAVQRAMLASL